MIPGVRILALLIVGLVLLGSLGAAGSPADAGDASLPSQAGVYQVHYTSGDQLSQIAAQFDLWEVDPESGYAVVALGAGDAAQLSSLGYRLLPAPDLAHKLVLGPPSYPCYRDVDQIYALLQQMTATYPSLTELVDYGNSWRKMQGLSSGYDLFVLRMTNEEFHIPKPRFFLMANIHARELTTPETAIYFVQHLLENYGMDADATWIMDYHEIYVIVTANPDGRRLVEDGCYQRKNRNDTLGNCQECDPWGYDHHGVDLNRNNPYHWGGASYDPCSPVYHGSAAASEPETDHLNVLIRSLFPDQRAESDIAPAPEDTTGLLISLHAYGRDVLWPWGWTAYDAPNAAGLQTLGRKFAFFNGYDARPSSELYPTTGDTTDWAYGELGIPAYTFELGNFFFQPCDDLQGIMQENLGALLYAAKVPRRPYMMPAGPDTVSLSVQPAAAAPGTAIALEATINDIRFRSSREPDPAEPVQNVTAAVYHIDALPWITATVPMTHSMMALDGVFDQPVEQVGATLDTSALDAGRHTIFVRGQDAAGNWGAVSAIFLTVGEPAYRLYCPLVTREN